MRQWIATRRQFAQLLRFVARCARVLIERVLRPLRQRQPIL